MDNFQMIQRLSEGELIHKMDHYYPNNGLVSKERLLDPKGVRLFDRKEELLVEHLGGAVGREVEPVEAGVGPVRNR